MHNFGYKSALARWACRYSDARPPRKADGVLLESETPPHMRGKVKRQQATAPPGQDHPRICGEKWTQGRTEDAQSGLPPQMRGKGQRQRLDLAALGITPAYAGKNFARTR